MHPSLTLLRSLVRSSHILLLSHSLHPLDCLTMILFIQPLMDELRLTLFDELLAVRVDPRCRAGHHHLVQLVFHLFDLCFPSLLVCFLIKDELLH